MTRPGIITRLREILAQAAVNPAAKNFAKPDQSSQAVTSTDELQVLQRSALDALYRAGEDGSHAYREIKALDFTGLFPSSPGLTQRGADEVILKHVARFSELLELAAHRVEAAEQTDGFRTRSRRTPLSKNAKAIEKRSIPKRASKPAESRAKTIARLMNELNRLKPQMDSEENYGRLAERYPEYLCFKIAQEHPKLRLKIENLQAHREHVLLALQLASAHLGVALETARIDWKKYKPRKFRKHRS